MKLMRLIAILILIPFTALTIYAIIDVGYLGVIEYQAASSAGVQVFADLSIVLLFFTLWMFPHARHTKRNPWPYAMITFFIGSFGPLLYFAFAKSDDPLWPVVDASNAPSKHEGA